MAKAQDYQWSSGARKHGFGKCDAKKVATFLQKLERSGQLDRETVRIEAEKVGNPLHAGTAWHWGDDDAAAEAWRLQVASSAISGLRVIVVTKLDGEETQEPMPVFVSTEGRIGKRSDDHRSIGDVMSDPLLRAEYLTRLLKELRSIERQYSVALAAFPAVTKRWAELRQAIEKELPPAV